MRKRPQEEPRWHSAERTKTELEKKIAADRINKVKQQTKYKYKRKLKYFEYAYARDLVDLEDVKQILSSYRAHLSYGHTYKLQKRILGKFVLRKNP